MIVIKAGNKIIINPVEIYVTVAANNQYSIGAMTSNAYGDALDVWPVNRKGTGRKEAEEMLNAISETIAQRFKSPLPNVHVDVELLERKLKEKKENERQGSTLTPFGPADDRKDEV